MGCFPNNGVLSRVENPSHIALSPSSSHLISHPLPSLISPSISSYHMKMSTPLPSPGGLTKACHSTASGSITPTHDHPAPLQFTPGAFPSATPVPPKHDGPTIQTRMDIVWHSKVDTGCLVDVNVIVHPLVQCWKPGFMAKSADTSL